MSDCLQPHELQHARLLCPSPFPWVCANSPPLSQWCHSTISSSVTPFSSCPHFFPCSGSFPMSKFFSSGGQRIGASTSATVLPMSIQGWFTLRLTGLISLLSKGLSRVFSRFQMEAGRQRNQRSNCQHMLDPRKSRGISKEYLLLFHWLH